MNESTNEYNLNININAVSKVVKFKDNNVILNKIIQENSSLSLRREKPLRNETITAALEHGQ